ncbi:Cyclic di-GMP phosphodiesterase CdgJ [Vibrio stylophorae]|uniref:Cyclic di-GMP phosphodiesterase CdgJ n=1 Tax=Vibrio stylophorae TaxID=659351 RepID=A0ABN8DXL0_9VIBR|nr:HDOD domain-containing protein [Vibrio stylophorae]CAH0534716.1 Cyclic di-GMP phosphodiesterase CdgJ [Vibrio stylophorae]
MYSYVARQPILNRQSQTVGYELLFRDSPHNVFPQLDAHRATSRLVVDNFLNIDNAQISDGLRSFVNFPYESLVNLVPTLLPKEKLVVEILEHCTPDDELFEAVKFMHKKGYVLALDDFQPSPEWQRFIPYVHILKIDLVKTPLPEAIAYVKDNQQLKVKFLAEKVETQAQFEMAKDAGFHFFQGYFFRRPEMIKKRGVEPAQLTAVQLLQEVSREDINFDRIEKIIMQDVPLSYQLLRFVNNMANFETPITKFKQAVIYLGESNLRRFVSLVVMAHASFDKPVALYVLSLERARMCELLAQRIADKDTMDKAFIVGLFSMLDSLFDRPLEALIEMLPLEQSVVDAILKHQGLLGELLDLAESYSHGDWDVVTMYDEKLGINKEAAAQCYMDAARWSSQCIHADVLTK